MNRKKILIIILIVTLLLTVIVFSSSGNKEKELSSIDGVVSPHNKDVLGEQTIDNLKITEVSMLKVNDVSKFKALVTNKTANTVNIKRLKVIFSQKTKKTDVVVLENVKLAGNDNVRIDVETEIDLSLVTDIEYILE